MTSFHAAILQILTIRDGGGGSTGCNIAPAVTLSSSLYHRMYSSQLCISVLTISQKEESQAKILEEKVFGDVGFVVSPLLAGL